MEGELQNLRTQKDMFEKIVEPKISKAVIYQRAPFSTAVRIINSVRSRGSSRTMQVLRQVSAYSEKLLSALQHYGSVSAPERRGYVKECNEGYAVEAGSFGLLALSLFAVKKAEKNLWHCSGVNRNLC